MRGKRVRCPNVICQAIFEAHDDSERAPVEALAEDDFPGDEESAPPPKPVEMKKPEAEPKPVKRKPVPRPIEPEPAADFPDDYPGGR